MFLTSPKVKFGLLTTFSKIFYQYRFNSLTTDSIITHLILFCFFCWFILVVHILYFYIHMLVVYILYFFSENFPNFFLIYFVILLLQLFVLLYQFSIKCIVFFTVKEQLGRSFDFVVFFFVAVIQNICKLDWLKKKKKTDFWRNSKDLIAFFFFYLLYSLEQFSGVEYLNLHCI